LGWAGKTGLKQEKHWSKKRWGEKTGSKKKERVGGEKRERLKQNGENGKGGGHKPSFVEGGVEGKGCKRNRRNQILKRTSLRDTR